VDRGISGRFPHQAVSFAGRGGAAQDGEGVSNKGTSQAKKKGVCASQNQTKKTSGDRKKRQVTAERRKGGKRSGFFKRHEVRRDGVRGGRGP